jgi:hypothetical protein
MSDILLPPAPVIWLACRPRVVPVVDAGEALPGGLADACRRLARAAGAIEARREYVPIASRTFRVPNVAWPQALEVNP